MLPCVLARPRATAATALGRMRAAETRRQALPGPASFHLAEPRLFFLRSGVTRERVALPR